MLTNPQVGQQVRRHPKTWPDAHRNEIGTIVRIRSDLELDQGWLPLVIRWSPSGIVSSYASFEVEIADPDALANQQRRQAHADKYL